MCVPIPPITPIPSLEQLNNSKHRCMTKYFVKASFYPYLNVKLFTNAFIWITEKEGNIQIYFACRNIHYVFFSDWYCFPITIKEEEEKKPRSRFIITDCHFCSAPLEPPRYDVTKVHGSYWLLENKSCELVWLVSRSLFCLAVK